MANQTISERVDQAFAAMRSGDLAPSSGLEDAGPGIIPAVVPYLHDDNEDVRRHAVTLLGLTKSADAAPTSPQRFPTPPTTSSAAPPRRSTRSAPTRFATPPLARLLPPP